VFLLLAGALVIAAGLFLRGYPRRKSVRGMKLYARFNNLASNAPLKHFLNLFTGGEKKTAAAYTQRIIKRSESRLTANSLLFAKLLSLIIIVLLVTLVRSTNISATRQSIIAEGMTSANIFTGNTANDITKSIETYAAILDEIGEKAIRELDDTQILEHVKKVLPGILKTDDKSVINRQSSIFLDTYKKVIGIPLFNYWSVIAIIFSLWIPEAFLMLKSLVLAGMYRKEAVKLENVFELLGNVQGIKTIDILSEMGKASRVYRKHIISCIDKFKTDREAALMLLKESLYNTRFKRLTDVMRIFCITDRSLAMQILEKNRIEQEEDMLMSAQEDVDTVDIIAFVSVVPVIWLLANLMLKPMLDTIFEAFRYV
jgi:hypothetical protein